MEKIRVLLADDDSAHTEELTGYLNRMEETTVVGRVNDGLSLLDELNTQAVDVVLLDLVMPRLDGFGVLERLQQMDLPHKPRLVALTALMRDDFVQRAVNLGLDYYMLKPYDQRELLSSVEAAMELSDKLSKNKLFLDYFLQDAEPEPERTEDRSDNERLLGVRERIEAYIDENYAADLEKTKAEIAALEKVVNNAQPTAEDFEKVEAYVAELKAKAEADRKAKEEKEHTARLAAINEAKVKTQNTIARAVKMYPVTEGAPVVEVPFSEFVGLYEIIDKKQNTWSVKAADMILGELDMWQHEKRETSDAYGWYEKTDFTIHYTDENGEDSVYSGRYDIGDGEGGLLNHIRNFGEWHRTHEEFGKEKAIPDETNEILEFVKMIEKAA